MTVKEERTTAMILATAQALAAVQVAGWDAAASELDVAAEKMVDLLLLDEVVKAELVAALADGTTEKEYRALLKRGASMAVRQRIEHGFMESGSRIPECSNN